MSAVCVLTPLVISAWPALASAILGAAASMGFSIVTASEGTEARPSKRRVETEVENSEVLADEMGRGEKIVVQKAGITIEFRQDARGACRVCVSGDAHSDRELRKIGEEIAGRVVQQFAYHKLMTELKERNYSVVEEEVMKDESVRIHLRL